jgi:metal transporter CNNM
MYILFPVAYPVARLLDHLLGASHGNFLNRAGLKTLVMLHECLNFSSERLNREEVTVISSMLDLKSIPVSSIMTPFSKLYTLSMDKALDEITRCNILNSGYSGIPIYQAHRPSSFVGVLPVKSLVALNFEEKITAKELTLDSLLVVRPEISCQEILRTFRDRKVQMVLVTERGMQTGEPLGIVTARDILNQLIGK